MELTSFQELINSFILIASNNILEILILPLIIKALQYVNTKIYLFDNDKIERIGDKAIKWAKGKVANSSKDIAKNLDLKIKIKAKDYFNVYVTPKQVKKYSLDIDKFLERKLSENK